jgi:hypothetical protein
MGSVESFKWLNANRSYLTDLLPRSSHFPRGWPWGGIVETTSDIAAKDSRFEKGEKELPGSSSYTATLDDISKPIDAHLY